MTLAIPTHGKPVWHDQVELPPGVYRVRFEKIDLVEAASDQP
jgi:hypothetical protein